MEGDVAGVVTDTAKGAGYGYAIGRPMEKAMSSVGGVPCQSMAAIF